MIYIVNNLEELKIIAEKSSQVYGTGRNTEIIRSWLKGKKQTDSGNVLVIQDRLNSIQADKWNNKCAYIIPDYLVDEIADELEHDIEGDGNIIKPELFSEKDSHYFSDGSSTISFKDLSSARNSYISSWNESRIEMGEGVIVNNALIESQDNSLIVIEAGVYIDSGTQIVARHGSEIHIGANVSLGMRNKVACISDSMIRIGNRTVVGGNSEVVSKQKACINIGENVSLSNNNRLGAKSRKIILGDECLFSYDIALDQNHGIFDDSIHEFVCDSRDTVIGKHVWVGKGAFIMPGVKIGDGSIVGAMSFVNGDFPENSELAGAPAKIKKINVRWEK